MKSYSLSHLSDPGLSHDLDRSLAREDSSTAYALAHIAEFDARKLYLPAGYDSMRDYCVLRLHRSEDAAYKRIQAARSAREFPALFEAVADGRLHLSAVVLLGPHLTSGNADELIAASAHKTKRQIEALLAERFPRSEGLPLVLAIPSGTEGSLAPGRVEPPADPASLAPGRVESDPHPRVEPIASKRFLLQLTIGQETYDRLRVRPGAAEPSSPIG